MRIVYLQYFLDVAQYRSIAKAARANFISPQGMSRVIRELEQEFGCSLVERFPNSLQLSDVGVELLPQIQRVVDEYNVLHKSINEISERESRAVNSKLFLYTEGNVRFFIPYKMFKSLDSVRGSVASYEIDSTMVFDALRAHAAQQQKTEAKIGAIALFGIEREGVFDVLNEFLASGDFAYCPYLRTSSSALVSSSSAMAKKDAITREDEFATPIAVNSEGLTYLLETIIGEGTVELNETEAFDDRIELVKQGKAMTFAPSTYCAMPETDMSGMVAVPLEAPCTVEFGFVGAADDLESLAFADLRAALDAFYGKCDGKVDFELLDCEKVNRRG